MNCNFQKKGGKKLTIKAYQRTAERKSGCIINQHRMTTTTAIYSTFEAGAEGKTALAGHK
jgi:hypothetical protein